MFLLTQQIPGELICFLDFNNDLKMDLLIRHHDHVQVFTNNLVTFTKQLEFKIEGTVDDCICSDLDGDGRIDLVVSQRNGDQITSTVYLQNENGFNSGASFFGYNTMPWIIDYHKSRTATMMSYNTENEIVFNDYAQGKFQSTPSTFNNGCKSVKIHSNAFVDLNGDCLADVVITCTKDSKNYLQLWTNTAEGFTLVLEEVLMDSSGRITFVDLDLDGAIDLLWPVCTSSGCKIVVIYGKSLPICKYEGQKHCKSSQDLCVVDSEYKLSFDSPQVLFTNRIV